MHCPASGIRGTVYPVVYGKRVCWLHMLTSLQRFVNLGIIWDDYFDYLTLFTAELLPHR